MIIKRNIFGKLKSIEITTTELESLYIENNSSIAFLNWIFKQLGIKNPSGEK